MDVFSRELRSKLIQLFIIKEFWGHRAFKHQKKKNFAIFSVFFEHLCIIATTILESWSLTCRIGFFSPPKRTIVHRVHKPFTKIAHPTKIRNQFTLGTWKIDLVASLNKYFVPYNYVVEKHFLETPLLPNVHLPGNLAGTPETNIVVIKWNDFSGGCKEK